jgi:7-keto-8-aminopelargonate synthetase-like enzyme
MQVPPPPGAEESVFRTAVERNRPSIFDKCLRYTQADDTKALGIYPYFRLIETGQDTEVFVDGHKMLMLGSNSYLELTTHPKVKERAIEAIRRYGTGCAGSRFLNGTLPIHLELERRLADLVGKEAALVFSTGYQTNTGVLSCLVQRGEYILSDKLNHACIVDGAQLSPGTMIRYNHNDMRDLERRLADLPASAGKLIVSDGVFSMEGDICELPGMVRLARKYGAQVMLDDAHSIGVLGPR